MMVDMKCVKYFCWYYHQYNRWGSEDWWSIWSMWLMINEEVKNDDRWYREWWSTTIIADDGDNDMIDDNEYDREQMIDEEHLIRMMIDEEHLIRNDDRRSREWWKMNEKMDDE